MWFVAISSDNVLVPIVLQFFQGGCKVANESITWVIVIAIFEWCPFLLVPGHCHCNHRWGNRCGSRWWHRGWTCHWCRTLAIPIVLVCQLWLISTGSMPWSLWVELCLQVSTGLWQCEFHSSWQWLVLSCYLVMKWLAMFQSGMVVWSDNFQLCCISIRPRIDGWCSMYCCRVLARRAGEMVVIALVLLNMICRDCLWINGRARQV